jgi:SPP1 gp7 family putative phage head morphogenesis protein
MRGAGSIRLEINSILNDTEKELVDLIKGSINKSTQAANLRSALKIEKQIRKIRGNAWKEIAGFSRAQYREVVKDEYSFLGNAIETVSPVILHPKELTSELVEALITSSPFEGKTFNAWAKDLERSDIDKITSSLKIGIAQGESGQQIARRIVGTKKLRGKDGVTQITRRNAEAISITAMNHFSGQAKTLFAKNNNDIIKKEIYTATLDSNTTRICSSLDGTVFPVGTGRFPPLHIRCRSVRIAILDDTELVTRPYKASTKQQLIREYNKANGLSAKTRAGLPRGHKGKFDAFSRKRVREMTGQVPGKTTYTEFLKRQSVEFQNDTLGVGKAKLFRKGVTLDKFVNRAGDELTLAQIKAADASAFKSAGLAQATAPIKPKEVSVKTYTEKEFEMAKIKKTRKVGKIVTDEQFSQVVRGVEQIPVQWMALANLKNEIQAVAKLKSAGAYFFTGSKKGLIKVKTTNHPKLYDNKIIDKVTRHEIGHAVDWESGKLFDRKVISESPVFQSAFSKDVAKIKATEKFSFTRSTGIETKITGKNWNSNAKYYFERPRERWAELFALLNAPKNTDILAFNILGKTADIRKHFPNSLKAMEDLLDDAVTRNRSFVEKPSFKNENLEKVLSKIKTPEERLKGL